MKKTKSILIGICTVIIAFSTCCVYASGAATTTRLPSSMGSLSTTRRTGLATNTVASTTEESDTSQGTTESTTETTTRRSSGLAGKTTTVKNTEEESGTHPSDTTTTIRGTTSSGTTSPYNSTEEAPAVVYTTYAGNNLPNTEQQTFTTAPISIPDDDEFTSIGSTYNVSDSHDIEIYTWYDNTTSLDEPVTEEVEVKEKKAFHFTTRYLIGIIIIIMVGLIVGLVTFIKSNKDFRSSLYFKFK